MEARAIIKWAAWLAGATVISACTWGCGDGDGTPVADASPLTVASPVAEVCPAPSEGGAAFQTVTASGWKVRYSEPPEVFAEAHGRSLALSHGESEWCGIISDVFHVATSDSPLVVAPAEEITIPNPLPHQHLYDAGIHVDIATADPTPLAGTLIWPLGPAGGSGHGLHWDDDRLAFTADDAPGLYVVSLWLSFDKSARRFTSNRSAYYALLIEVQE